MSKRSGSRLVALCFGAEDPLGLARFWADALRWDLGDQHGDRVELDPTDGTGFTLAFVPVAPDQTSRRRLHVDLTTRSLDDQHESVDALIELGARHVDVGQTEAEGHIVLADPEGNELCLIGPDNQFLADCPRLGSITCDGGRATGVFWSDALGWPLVWDQDDETAIRAPEGTGPMITWGGPPLNPKDGANRLHLDLAAWAPADHGAEVDRLLGLGARRTSRRPASSGSVELADPDGNELRLLTPWTDEGA